MIVFDKEKLISYFLLSTISKPKSSSNDNFCNMSVDISMEYYLIFFADLILF